MTITPVTSQLSPHPEAKRESQIVEFLEEHKEIEMILPVLIGLLITGRLQLRGVNALLANLLIATLSNQIIVQLKKQASHPSPTPVSATEPDTGQRTLSFSDTNIVHSVPGRIRLRVPCLKDDRSFARRLEQHLKQDSAISGVRLNREAASVVIYYKISELSEIELSWRLTNLLRTAEASELLDPV